MGSSCSVMNFSPDECSPVLNINSKADNLTSIKPTKYWDSGVIRDEQSDNISNFSPVTERKSQVLVPLEFSLPVVSISENLKVVSFKEYKKWLQMKRLGLISSSTDIRCRTATIRSKSSPLQTPIISPKRSLNNCKNSCQTLSAESLLFDVFLSHEISSKSANRITAINKCVSGKLTCHTMPDSSRNSSFRV